MNKWFSRISKDYFTFSKKERQGLLVTSIITLLIYIILHYLPENKSNTDASSFQQELAKLKIIIDSTKRTKNYFTNNEDEQSDYERPYRYNQWQQSKPELFFFDPNTIDEAGWQKLGLRDKTITIIQNYLAKGYRFRKPEDINKIYGLSEKEANRLMPYIQIKSLAKDSATTSDHLSNTSNISKPAINKTIEINSADTSAFIALPGIGNKLANRIVQYRNKLGGFYNINQIAETYGLQDSTFQQLKPRFTCNAGGIKQLNINTADVNELKSHPYLRWNLANLIINYRQQHGGFKTVEELKKIDLVTEDIFQKIKPYLRL